MRFVCIPLFFIAWTSLVWAQTGGISRNDIVQREVAIPSDRSVYVHESFLRLFQNYAKVDPNNKAKVEIQLPAGRAMAEFQPGQNKLRIEGPPLLSTDIANLLTTLAIHPADESVKVLPLRDNAQASLQQFTLLTTPPPGVPGRLAAMPQEQPAPPALQQPIDPAKTKLGPASLPLPQFEGVQMEMLPEIDAIILRGRDQQLNDLAEIIKRLDEASRLTRPEIEVVLLKHVGSDATSKLITLTQEKLTGTLQGRVTVSPLGNPNALLLIGWGDAIVSMKALIEKIDQPSAPESQFEVFQLQHAIANEVQKQLQSFFLNRAGLAPVIHSMVDNRTNAVVVHASPRDIQEIRALITQLDVPRGTLMQQARVFQLKHSLAADIAKSLQQALASSSTGPGESIQLLDQNGRPLVTSGILSNTKITVNDSNNTLLISGSSDSLPLIEQLIAQLDMPGMVAKIKIFPIKNGDAGALVETLRSLLPAQSSNTPSSPQLSSDPNETALLPLRFTVDTRSNNIIVVGSAGTLKIVEALIVRLDESDKMQRKSTVYQLKNSPAVDVALAINEFLRSKRQVEIAAPGANNPFEQIEKEVVVVPEPVQNKLILSATPRYYDEISRLIEQLDQQPPQVMIQVMIAEITLGNTDEFGVEMGLQDSVLFDRSLLGNLATRTTTTTTSTPAGVVTQTAQEIVAASNVPGFNFNSNEPLGNSGSARALGSANRVGGQGLSNFSVGRSNEELGFGGLVLSASSENVSFLLRALQDSRRLEILSRPQVLTLDNQQAFIQVGQRVPRIVNSIINQNGAQNNVALENVGLIIGVTPRISPEGNVVMEIDAEKSKLGPESEGIPVSISNNGTVIRSPRVDTITAQATVSAADGETIILGGLISRSTRTEHRQVPWLGDIPIIKHLFSYDLNTFLRTELLIIMTPHVVRSQGDMERLKQAEFARMSWCEADVFDIHGDVYPASDMTVDMIKNEEWDVVYPDIDPRGNVPSPTVGPPLSSDPNTSFVAPASAQQLVRPAPSTLNARTQAPSTLSQGGVGR